MDKQRIECKNCDGGGVLWRAPDEKGSIADECPVCKGEGEVDVLAVPPAKIDKQQAAEKYAKKWINSPAYSGAFAGHIAGWEAHETQQSPASIAFLKEVREKINEAAQGLVDYDFLSEINEAIKNGPKQVAQSPTDAVAHAMDFAKFLANNGIHRSAADLNLWTKDHHDYGPLSKYYTEFNPSRAAPQADKDTNEERDLFAMQFLAFALHDPRAKSLITAGTPAGAILAFYKDRPYLDEDTSKQ